MRNIVIVVITYNRPKSLSRLLESLNNADYLGINNVDLIVSCDFSDNNNCKNVANEFQWKHGDKEVILHAKNLGLRKHIFYCGDLVSGYDGIIMLEDDLWVSPNYYRFIVEADLFFKDDLKIGQISLYNYQYDEYSFSRFLPIKQDGDNYFMQVPSSCGQYWNKEQWTNFKFAYDQGDIEIEEDALLPNHVIEHWPESSWKKYFYNYLIKNNLYVVYPYSSLSTNFGEIGTHFPDMARHIQTYLGFNQVQFSFCALDLASVVYDYNFELHSISVKHFLNKDFRGLDLEFDLNGTKDLNKVKSEYLISSKFCENPIRQFGNELLPQEVNIFVGLKGEFYSLGKTEDFSSESTMDKIVRRNLDFLPALIKKKIENRIINQYEKRFAIRIVKKINLYKNHLSKNLRKINIIMQKPQH